MPLGSMSARHSWRRFGRCPCRQTRFPRELSMLGRRSSSSSSGRGPLGTRTVRAQCMQVLACTIQMQPLMWTPGSASLLGPHQPGTGSACWPFLPGCRGSCVSSPRRSCCRCRPGGSSKMGSHWNRLCLLCSHSSRRSRWSSALGLHKLHICRAREDPNHSFTGSLFSPQLKHWNPSLMPQHTRLQLQGVRCGLSGLMQKWPTAL